MSDTLTLAFRLPLRGSMNDRPHLLIVDDDREIRTLLSQYLEKHDFRTTAVEMGKRCAASWSVPMSTSSCWI